MMLFVRILVCIFALLPAWSIFFLFGLGARIQYFLAFRRRLTAYKNLKIAFPDHDFKQIRSVAYRSACNFGYNIAETLRMSRINDAYIKKYLSVPQREFLDRIHPAVTVGVHEGSWEMLMASLASFFPYAILAQQQKSKTLDHYLNRLRRAQGISVIDSSNLRELVEYFKKGYWVGFAVDSGFEDNALSIPFFGRTVPTPSGAVRFAKRFNRDILCGYVQRRKGPYHTLTFRMINDVADKETASILREINQFYEESIRQAPAEYVWSYKRFKHAVERDVLILDDGRAGHLHQSRSLFQLLVKARPEYVFREKVVAIRYKQKSWRMGSDLSALCANRFCAACGACLRWFLSPQSYHDLVHVNADVIISAGSALASINVIAGRAYQAVSLSVFSGNIPPHKFHTVFAPVHDRLRGKNIVSFTGALDYRDEGVFQEQLQSFRKAFQIDPTEHRYTLGILVGGPTRSNALNEDSLRALLLAVDRYATEHAKEIRVHITTSRRTSPSLEDFIHKTFSRVPYPSSVIIANRKNYPWAIGGIIAGADSVLVTSDSISMVTESATHKDTVILDVLPDSIQRTFACTLQKQENALVAVHADDIYSLLTKLKDGTIRLKRIKNHQVIIEHLKTKVNL